MPQAPRFGLDAPGELDLGEALLEQPREETADLVGDAGCGADALDLPGGLDGAVAHDGAADVLERRLREEVLEAPEAQHRQHVQLEPETRGQGVVAVLDRRRQIPDRRQRDDRAEGRLAPRPRHDLAYEERRLTFRRHVQVRLLDRAGVVVEVGVLLQEGGIEILLPQDLLETDDPPLQLSRRHKRRARLHRLRREVVRHAALNLRSSPHAMP